MRRVLFVSGPRASGKTTYVDWLSHRHNFTLLDTGPIMRSLKEKEAPNLTMGEWVRKIEKDFGKSATNEKLYSVFLEKLKNPNYDANNIIFNGFRELSGIKFMLDKINPSDYEIIFIDASNKLLYKNYCLREKNEMSYNEFVDMIEKERTSGGLDTIRNYVKNCDGNKCQYILKETNNTPIRTKLYKEFIQVSRDKSYHKAIER